MFSLLAVSNSQNTAKPKDIVAVNLLKEPKSGVRVYASLPITQPSISAYATAGDARAALIKQYLVMYNSPLIPYSDYIVKAADKNGIDFRLITAIAQQESNLCKIIPPDSHNCWGWGITSVSSLSFDSYEQGIDTVSKGLKENYIDEGYVSIADIMSKYTPMSNGSWAHGVNTFLDDIATQ